MFCSFSCCFYYVHWRNKGRLLFPLSATTNLQWVINDYWGFWFAKEPGAWALAAPAAISWTWPKRNAVDRSPEHCFWPSNRPLWQHGVWLQRLDECRPFLLFRCRLGGGSVQNRITDYTVHALLYCLEKNDIFYLICLMGKRMRILSPSEELVAPYFQTNRGGRWNIRGCAFSSLLPVGWSLDQDGNTDARMWFQTVCWIPHGCSLKKMCWLLTLYRGVLQQQWEFFCWCSRSHEGPWGIPWYVTHSQPIYAAFWSRMVPSCSF